MKLYFVYILLCSDKSYYTGITNSLDKRIAQHNSDKYPHSYVHNKRPVELVWSDSFSNPETAISMEKKLKKWSRAKKEALIRGDFEKLKALSRKKFK